MIKTTSEIKYLGNRQMRKFGSQWLEQRKVSTDTVIKKTKSGTLSNISNFSKSTNTKKKTYKQNFMFGQFYMKTQAHGGDIQYLFTSGTRKAAPSRFRNKAYVEDKNLIQDEDVAVTILKRTVLINIVRQKSKEIFSKCYKNKNCKNRITITIAKSEPGKVTHVDREFDMYNKNKLKATVGEKQLKGNR